MKETYFWTVYPYLMAAGIVYDYLKVFIYNLYLLAIIFINKLTKYLKIKS